MVEVVETDRLAKGGGCPARGGRDVTAVEEAVIGCLDGDVGRGGMGGGGGAAKEDDGLLAVPGESTVGEEGRLREVEEEEEVLLAEVNRGSCKRSRRRKERSRPMSYSSCECTREERSVAGRGGSEEQGREEAANLLALDPGHF